MHCNIIIQYKSTKRTFPKLMIQFLIFLCLLHISNPRAHLQSSRWQNVAEHTLLPTRLITSIRVKRKSKKVLPRQAKVAQGVPGKLRPRIFLTFRHYKGGRSFAKCTGRLYPRRNPWYSLSKTESTSGHIFLSGVPRKKSPVTTLGIDPGISRLVAQRLNHYATPGSSV